MDNNQFLDDLDDKMEMNALEGENPESGTAGSPARPANKKGPFSRRGGKPSNLFRIRNWSLSVRFAMVIFALAAISLSVLTWYSNNTIERDMVEQVGRNFEQQVLSLNGVAVSYFREKVTQLQSLASTDAVRTVIVGKNASYFGTAVDIQSRILELDALWVEAADDDTLINQIISPSSWVNPLTYQMLDFRNSFPENAEIFVTDKYGAIVAATDRTSDYYQADEEWWQLSWNGGKGAIYISQPEYDESTNVTGVQIAVPVMNSTFTQAVGVIRSTMVLDQLFATFDEVQFGESGNALLIDGSGSVIYEPEGEKMLIWRNALADDLRMHLLSGKTEHFTGTDQYDQATLFAHTPLFSSLPDESQLAAQKFKLETWTSTAINDLDWTVIVRQWTSESLVEVKRVGTNIGYMNLFVIVVSVLVGGYFARTLTNPLVKLAETADQLGKGNLSARVEVSNEDEIGFVARTVNQMADQLESILAGLEETIEDRTRELRERNTEMEASQRVTFAASERTSPEDFLDLLVNLINDQFDVYHTQVYILDDERKYAVLRESTGYAGRQLLQRGHRLDLERPSLVATAIKENRSVLVPDVSTDANWASNPLLPFTKSELVVPLRVGNQVIGAIDIQDRVPNRFRAGSVPVFEAMTEHVAFLFENNELLEQITRQTQELETFTNQLRSAADLAEHLSTIRDPEKLLAEAVDQIQLRFGLYHAHIYLLDAEGENLVVRAGSGEVGRILKESGHAISLTAETSLVARSARTRGAVLVADTANEADFFPNPLLPQTSSEVSIPLIAGEKLLGVLDVQDDDAGRFTQTDVDTLSTLGGQIASALDNATLFQEAQTAQARMTGIVEGSADAIITINEEQEILMFNKGAEEMFGYRREEILGQKLYTLMPGRYGQSHLRHTTKFRNESGPGRQMSPRAQIYGKRKDGSEFPGETAISKLTLPDGQIIFTAIMRDTSASVAARNAVVQSDQLKSEFLANMSHELRTPLNSIIGYTDVLLEGIDGELDAEVRADVQAIHENSQNLLRIINDILDLAKIEAGRMTLELSHVDIKSLLEEVKTGAAGLLVNKNVAINISVAADVTSVEADKIRLTQILNNLVSNAAKFTHEGEINLRATLDEKGYVLFDVEDTGVGISSKDLDKIFEEFSQADTSTSRAVEGTGLGLTITRRLAQMHGGSVEVHSQLGEGSTFTVRLPLQAQVPSTVSTRRVGTASLEGNGATKSQSAAKRVTGMLKEAIGIGNGSGAKAEDEENHGE